MWVDRLLFNCAGYIESHGGMTSNDELISTRKEAVVALLKVDPRIYVKKNNE
jgi:hypothetical protein